MPLLPKASVEMNDRPLFLAERIDAVVSDHPRRIDVVRTATEHPWIAHVRKLWVGATYHDRPADPLDVRCHSVDLSAANRSDESRNIFVSGKLAEGEHNPGIARLVILYDKLYRSAKHATCLVNLLDGEISTLCLVTAGFGRRPGDRSDHSNFEWLCRADETGEYGQKTS
jgi:hypothetical protein